jgi:putative tributyrin esterase
VCHHQGLCEEQRVRRAGLRTAICVLTVYALLPASAQTAGMAPARSSSQVRAVSPLIRDASFHSVALKREMKYCIYLPHAYSASARRYPVLYLLHGLYGDYRNWDANTHLARYMAGRDWIVVMPDAGDSWYANSATQADDRFEDYIAKDLVREVDGKYRSIRERQGRAIAGLSMGGYGAMKFALKYPGEYGFAGSLSGAFDAARDLADQVAEFHDQIVKVLGEGDNPARGENDVFVLLKRADPTQVPYLFLACGSADRFLRINREFVKELSAHRIAYEYHETSGGHDWQYWDSAVQPMLNALQVRLGAQKR